MDRDYNTRLRKLNLHYVPDQVKPLMYEYERRYGKYCLLPIAVPVITDDKIVDWFFEHCRAVTKIRADVADTEYGYTLFNSVNVYIDERSRSGNPIWTDNYYPNFERDFPHFYQQMMDLLPMARIPRFTFWNSIRPIAPHRDHACLLDMPNSFRIMLHDTNPDSTLYVYEDTETYQAPRSYVPRLPDTNTFAWNNLRVQHGSNFSSDYAKVLLLVNDFIPHMAKYARVIEDSIARYTSELVVSNHELGDFINLD